VKGGRILIVDDEPMVRETISRVLVEEGYAVDCAADGSAALVRCRAHPPDVILLDLMMPGMNGRQFLATLRGELGCTEVPVVVMTAVHGLGQRALSLGADDMVEKPFDVDELLNKVALAMFRSRHPSTTPDARDAADARGAAGSAGSPGSGDATDDADFGDALDDFDFGAGEPSASTDEPPGGDRAAPGPGERTEKGVVLLVDHDRASLQRLDSMLSQRGYTVVSMTRVTPQLPRLARVLQPRAVLLDVQSQGSGAEIVRALRSEPALDAVPILVFSRTQVSTRAGSGLGGPEPTAPSMMGAGDEELLRFVEFPRGQA
jgi:CheY-like chemotaxis protein